MARKNYKDEFVKATRNRGEEWNEPQSNLNYDYQRPNMEQAYIAQERAIRRDEARHRYVDLYELSQRRDQRAFARTLAEDNEFYAGLDPRRRQEMADGGLIREDQRAFANLPRQAIHHEYPQEGYYKSPYIDDSVRGMDDLVGRYDDER